MQAGIRRTRRGTRGLYTSPGLEGLLPRGEAAKVRTMMYSAVLVTLLAASQGMSQAPDAAGTAVAAPPEVPNNGPRTGTPGAKGPGLRKGCRDLKRANDQRLAGWSQYQPKAAMARKTWKKLLADTPADQRTPVLLAEAWDLTGRSDPCFLYLRAMASLEQGDAVDAYRAVRDFLDFNPARTFAGDRTAAQQIWDSSNTYKVNLAVEGAPQPGLGVRGTAELTRFASDGAERIDDDRVGKRYCEDRPERCAQRSFELELERPVLELPIGVWRVSVDAPFELVDVAAGTPKAVNVVIRGRPPKRFEGEGQSERPDVVVRYVAPPAVPAPVAEETRPAVPGPVPDGQQRPVDAPKKKQGPRELPLVEVSIGGIAVITGTVLLGVGGSKARALRGRSVDQCRGGEGSVEIDQCRAALGRTTNLGTSGAAVLGVGIGTIVTGALWWNASQGDGWKRQRRLRGAVGLGVGAAVAVLGGVGIGVGGAQFSAHYGPTSTAAWSEQHPSAIRLHAVGGLGLGLGLGLAVTSGVNWAVYGRSGGGREAYSRAGGLQVTPLRLHGGGGLALAGRF